MFIRWLYAETVEGESKMGQKKKLYFVATLIMAGLLLFLLGTLITPERGEAEEATPVQTIVIEDQSGFTSAIAEVADILMPTVVYINVTGTVKQRGPGSGPFGNDPFFRYFFGPPESEREVPVSALGSGVIISKDGYIITNNHVVENADTIAIKLYDGTEVEAELVGTDPQTDLAMVKIDPLPGMKYAEFGDSDECKIGEWVIAIGAPRGLDWTVTAGIISAKNRTDIGVLGPTGYEDFIQTDASINPGNSGGPLINLRGKVIGVNSLIVSASQGSEGLGFAIPANLARNISDSLIKYGKVVRGYLGVQIQDVTPDMSKSMKLDKDLKGVIVADVFEGSPADKGGLQQGDVVISFNGKPVETVAELRNLVAQTRPGQTVTLRIIRDKKQMNVRVSIGDLEKLQQQALGGEGNETLGLTVEKVTQEIAGELGLKNTSGVVITRVLSGSPADRSGLKAGDIVFRVGNQVVKDTEQFNKLVSELVDSGKVMLLIRDVRTGRVGYIVVPVG
jgi:serine protease Do